MKISSLSVQRCVVASTLVPFMAAPIVANGALDDVVLLWGDTTQGRDMVGQTQTADNSYDTMSVEGACQLAASFVYMNMGSMAPAQLSSMMENLGLPVPGPGLPSIDCTNRDRSDDAYFIFTTCSMIMGNGPYWMRWTVPPLAPEATMVAIDTSKSEGWEVKLESAFDEVSDATPMAMGNLRDFSISATGVEKPITLQVSLEAGGFIERQYTARTYDFSYQGEIAGFGGFGLMAQLGRIESKGSADIAEDAPGADVIGQFYSNFRDNVVPSTGADSLFGGMMRQMAGLATRGIPVAIKQTNSAGMGMTSLMGDANVGIESESTSNIDRIMILPGRAATACVPTMVPEGVEIVDLGAQMEQAAADASAAFGGGQASGAAGAAPGMAEAMSEAMQGMTPEQQSAMQQVGGMLGGLFGGAAAAAGGASAPGAAPAAAPAATRPSLSSALMTDDLTQSAQNLLEALGYDPGNTDGELSVETSIAISQFQAERGLDVTGEVTPQLVGVLAAAVDAL